MFIGQMGGNTDVWQTTALVLRLRRRGHSQCIVSTTCCIDNIVSTHVKESGFLNPDSGIRAIFAVESGILGFGIQNTAQRIRNPTKDWNRVPRIRNPRHGIQNPRLSWIPLHEAKCQSNQAGSEKG